MQLAAHARWSREQDQGSLQARIIDWQIRNFGPSPVWHTMLGMTEEIGEYASSRDVGDRDGQLDALGDFAVYGMAFCAAHSLSFQALLNAAVLRGTTATPSTLERHMLRCVAGLSHAVLKRAQGIRGFHDDDKYANFVADKMSTLSGLCAFAGELLGAHYWRVVTDVTEQVLKRDWKAHPVDAAELAAK